MSRPKNLTVTRNNVVYSVTPKNLKAFLQSVPHGAPVLVGKALGPVMADLTGITADRAARLVATLTPVTETPTPVAVTGATVTADF